MSNLLRLAVCSVSIVAAMPLLAQTATQAQDPGPTVEGNTPDRVSLVNSCAGHKFETLVEIDAAKHRSTRIKLCSKPGATDADWVKTLHAAIDQVELRTMPPAAREQLIAQLQVEAAKYDHSGASSNAPNTGVSALKLGKGSFADTGTEPEVPFEVTALPPLPNPKGLASMRGSGSGAKAVAPVKPIRVTVKCLARGETGKPGTCDFFDKNTVLVMTANGGLEEGATMRFLRKGEEHDTIDLGPLTSGQTRRVPLPSDLCKGISYAKVQIQLVAPKATAAGATLGPYGLRC